PKQQPPPNVLPRAPQLPSLLPAPTPKLPPSGKEMGGGGEETERSRGAGAVQCKREKGRRGAQQLTIARERTNSESALEEEPRMDVSRLDLRIGRIVGVRYHPLAGALYVQEVDLGEPAPRTVVSALRHIPKEQLQGRLAVLLCNVRPCRVKGVVSTAMVLCGSAPNAHGEPDRELIPRERVLEQILPDLQTDSRGVATYRGVGFEVRGKGLCRAPTLTNS
ncbi:unnamed protein product, partial [Coregonus sp. 'balchen']